jgi:hypothetical protein
MRIHNLYTDPNGQSHFHDIEVEWVEEREAARFPAPTAQPGAASPPGSSTAAETWPSPQQNPCSRTPLPNARGGRLARLFGKPVFWHNVDH